MSVPVIIRGCVLLLVRTHTRNMCDRFRRKIHRYSNELLNISIKYMIISNIHSRKNLNNRNWLLRTAGRNTCLFSFGRYFVEKLLSSYNSEYQYYIYHIHQINGFSSVINPAGKWDRESSHLQQPEQSFPFSEAKVAWGFDGGSKVKRQSRHGNNLHPHASGSILPMNLASDSPKRKSLRKRKRPPRQPTTKGKNNKGSL